MTHIIANHSTIEPVFQQFPTLTDEVPILSQLASFNREKEKPVKSGSGFTEPFLSFMNQFSVTALRGSSPQ